ncbi:putative ABC transporter ATP-binding protein [compost metagenome]
MQSVNILIQALQQFEGTLIVVSHDRYFLDHVANKIWYIEDKQIKEYPGTYQEFEDWNSKRIIKPEEKKVEKKVVVEEPKKVKVAHTDDKFKLISKKNKELAALELKVVEKELIVKNLEIDLAKEEIYSNTVKLQEYTRNYNSSKAELTQLQKNWEELAEEIMELED